MTFKTSSSSWIIFKSALKRLKWLGILYGIILFLDGPLSVWMRLSYQREVQGSLWNQIANTQQLSQLFLHPIQIMMNVTIPVLFGLILFQYLQNERQSTLFHSFPIKRETLYIQNLLAGLMMIWVPILLNGLLLYGVFTSFGITEGIWPNYVNSSTTGIMSGNQPATASIGLAFTHWLLFHLLMTTVFYVFTVFVGMLTGNFILQGALTYIGMVLPVGLYILIKYNLWKLLFGYPREVNDKVFEWMSPLTAYLTKIERVFYSETSLYVGYFTVALVLIAVSIYLYKQRHVEAAGETLASEWIRQVFKYGVAACMALTAGLYFSIFNDRSAAVLYLGYLIGAVLGYVIADMIAYKSFRFYERWKGMLVFGAILLLLIFSVKLDVYGYEKYIPQNGQVKGVMLGLLNNQGPRNDKSLSGDEAIENVLALHQQILQHEKSTRGLFDVVNNPPYPNKAQDNTAMFRSVDIVYTLEKGTTVKRSYTIDISKYKEHIKPVFESDEAKKYMYSKLFDLKSGQIDKIEINNYHFNKNLKIFKAEELEEALAALQKDVMNVSYEAAIEGKVPSKANIDFYIKTGSQKNYEMYNLPYYSDFKNFEAFLDKYRYDKPLFIDPMEVSKIEIKEMGKEVTYQVDDKKSIEFLLDVSILEDEKMLEMRIQDSAYMEKTLDKQYTGKIYLANGKNMVVMFDTNPYYTQKLERILDK